MHNPLETSPIRIGRGTWGEIHGKAEIPAPVGDVEITVRMPPTFEAKKVTVGATLPADWYADPAIQRLEGRFEMRRVRF